MIILFGLCALLRLYVCFSIIIYTYIYICFRCVFHFTSLCCMFSTKRGLRGVLLRRFLESPQSLVSTWC